MSVVACRWPTTPPVIGCVAFTSDTVREIEVRPRGFGRRRFEIQHVLDGFPGFCVFFPPFDTPGEVVALDGRGGILCRQDLYTGRLPGGAFFGGGD